MGHAHHDVADAQRGCLLDERVEQRDQRLGAFQREALLPHVVGVQESLEGAGTAKHQRDALLAFAGIGGLVEALLHALLQPPALAGVLDVHVLHTDGAAVGGLQHTENLAQFHPVRADGNAMRPEALVKVAFGNPEIGKVQQMIKTPRMAEGVDLCLEVPDITIMVDQRVDLGLQHLPAAEFALGEGMLLRGHGSQSRAAAALLGEGQLKALEEGLPPLVQLAGIAPENFVQLLHIVRIPAVQGGLHRAQC